MLYEPQTLADIYAGKKVTKFIGELKDKSDEIIKKSKNAKASVTAILKTINDGIETQGAEITAEMLTEMTEKMLKAPEFKDEELKERFEAAQIAQQIFDDAAFECPTMEYKGTSRGAGAAKVGAIFFAVGTAVIICGNSFAGDKFSQYTGMAFALTAGISALMALIDYAKIEPKSERTELEIYVIKYLKELKGQFMAWLNGIAEEFHARADSFKQPSQYPEEPLTEP